MAYSEIICRRIDHICCRVIVHFSFFFLEGGLRGLPTMGKRGPGPGANVGGLLVKIKASCVFLYRKIEI